MTPFGVSGLWGLGPEGPGSGGRCDRSPCRGWQRDRHEVGQQFLVAVNWEGFGEEVSQVVGPFLPGDVEMPLALSITYPMEAHVDGLGAPDLDGVVC